MSAVGSERPAAVGLGGAALRRGRALLRRLVRPQLLPARVPRGVGPQLTPDKLPAALLGKVYEASDRHLAAALTALAPEWAIGIGGFAEKRIRAVLEGDLVDGAVARRIRVGQVLHPSPASPAANRGWVDAAEAQLAALGVQVGT